MTEERLVALLEEFHLGILRHFDVVMDGVRAEIRATAQKMQVAANALERARPAPTAASRRRRRRR